MKWTTDDMLRTTDHGIGSFAPPFDASHTYKPARVEWATDTNVEPDRIAVVDDEPRKRLVVFRKALSTSRAPCYE